MLHEMCRVGAMTCLLYTAGYMGTATQHAGVIADSGATGGERHEKASDIIRRWTL